MTSFDGSTVGGEDEGRLVLQLRRVWSAMADGEWHSPEDLERLTGDRWASISARLRDFRKDKFGGHTVQRVSRGRGLFEYRLRPSWRGLVVPRRSR